MPTPCRFCWLLCVLGLFAPLPAAEIHVAPAGDDAAAGTSAAPLRTVAAAQRAARRGADKEPVTVLLHAGTHYLPATLVLTPEDSVRHFNGFAADAFSPQRAARWADPRGGFIHAMHAHEWGDYHYVITGKDARGAPTYEGGWQNNRRMGMHAKYRMVENVFEELDAPGEWFHDARSRTLYLYPPPQVDVAKATIEVVGLRHLVEFRGSATRPVRFVTLRGITVRHAARTFMDNREPLLRSDWTTYRGGAVLFDGAEDCALVDSVLDQLGGNAVFVNNYNRRVTIRGCHIVRAGANGVAFVGDPAAVRSPLFEYNQRQSLKDIDPAPGPKSDNYPADCVVEDCLINETGRVEKQTVPVQVSNNRAASTPPASRPTPCSSTPPPATTA